MGCVSSRQSAGDSAKDDGLLEGPVGFLASFREKHEFGAAADPSPRAGGADLHGRRAKVLAQLNSMIEKQLNQSSSKSSAPALRALFLGTGESGKTTVLKQLRVNYGDSFTAFERFQYTKLIWLDTLAAMRRLVNKDAELADHGQRIWPAGELDAAKALVRALDLSTGALLRAETDDDARDFLSSHARPEPLYGKANAAIDYLLENDNDVESDYGCDAAAGGCGGSPGADESTRLIPAAKPAPRAQVAAAVKALWRSCPQRFKDMFATGELSMDTNAAYFFDRVEQLSSGSYLASNEDILRARIKTTGIVETTFNIKGSKLTVVDVGGQRTERRKWVHCFDDATTILFVCAVSEYDQTLEENSQVNRLEESLQVFEQTVNSPLFRQKSVTLFLNKMDVLEAKLPVSPFAERYPQFAGNPLSPTAVVDFIEAMFRHRFRGANRNLYCHRTCATDTHSMKFVVDSVTDMILYDNLKWAGLI